jgi:regulator of sigma E protease
MLELIFTNPVVAFVILVGLVVLFHELGHFLAGRALGVDVDEFSIGFGPRAVGFRLGRTDYKICWLPLGGYVRFYGAELGGEIPLEKRDRSILTARLYKRVLISAAGPFANFVLSLIIMIILSGIGMPQPSARVAVMPGKPAAAGGLQSGDRVVAIDGQTIGTWKEMTEIVTESPGKDLVFVVDRPGVPAPVEVLITPEVEKTESAFGEAVDVGRIGVTQFFPSLQFVKMRGGLVEAMGLETGEQILSVNGIKVTYLHEFFDAIDRHWSVSGPKDLATRLLEDASTAQSGVLEPLVLVVKPQDGVETVRAVRKDDLQSWAQRYVSLAADERIDGSAPIWTDVFLVTDLLIRNLRASGSEEGSDDFTGTVSGDGVVAPAEDTRTPLAACGLGPGVALRGIDGDTVLTSPVDLSLFLRKLADEAPPGATGFPVAFQIVRPDASLHVVSCTVPLVVRRDHLNRDRRFAAFPVDFITQGQTVEEVMVKSDGLLASITDGTRAVFEQAGTIFVGLKKLVSGSIPLANLGGPIQIARVAGSAAEGGLLLFFLTVSWMSVNIGMFNLLPLPALDGGALLMQGVEAAYGRPLPERVQIGVQRLGVFIILGLIVLVFYNDILRLLGG